MSLLHLDELKQILRECAGEDESTDLNADVLDVPFADLGYDSLAVLQVSGRVELHCRITLDEDDISTMTTPREFLALVDAAPAAGSVA